MQRLHLRLKLTWCGYKPKYCCTKKWPLNWRKTRHPKVPKVSTQEIITIKSLNPDTEESSSTNPQKFQISQKSHRKKIGLRSQLKPWISILHAIPTNLNHKGFRPFFPLHFYVTWGLRLKRLHKLKLYPTIIISPWQLIGKTPQLSLTASFLIL